MDYLSSGARLFYRSIGNGPPVVLLHPTPVHGDFWLPVVEELSPAFRVVVPDLRGHGASEAGLDSPANSAEAAITSAITIDTLAADVLNLLDHAGMQRAHFVGCSIGSYTLFALWKLAPKRIASMVFCCGKPHADTDAARSRRLEVIADVYAQGTGAFFENAVQTLVGKTSQARHPELKKPLLAMMQPMKPSTAIAVQRGLAERPDARPVAAGITAPCMVLSGAEDVASTPEEMEELHELLPRSEFHLLGGLGHYAPYEDPKLVSGLLRAFFDQHTI